MSARKRMIDINFACFGDYAEKLDNLGASLQEAFSKAMEQAAETVQEDTIEAMAKGNLPAGGKYSQGDTEAAIIRDAKVVWHGSVGEIGLGFDKTRPGAGGFLITGTPKMQPNRALEDIYGRKKYERDLKKDIEEVLQDEISKKMGG